MKNRLFCLCFIIVMFFCSCENKENVDLTEITTVNVKEVKLEKLKADIDPVLMEKYQTRRNDKKFPIIYGVDISTNSVYCPACATEMSLSQKNELASGEIKECETCRKLLYALEK